MRSHDRIALAELVGLMAVCHTIGRVVGMKKAAKNAKRSKWGRYVMGRFASLGVTFALVSSCFADRPFSAPAAEVQLLADVAFRGEIRFPDNLSAVAVAAGGRFLVVAADEGPVVQVLKRTGPDEYTLHETTPLIEGAKDDDEIDIEGIACSEWTVYAVGSHSRKRSLLKPDKTQKANRKRLAENLREPLREKVFRFELDAAGRLAAPIRSTSLRPRLENDELLAPFLAIPGKENGIDIEGIALAADGLVAAFRSPVFREGFAPVLFFSFDRPEAGRVALVHLGGRGIRDILRVSDGYLLIGGPVNNEPVSFELYHWDGRDGIPGKDVDLTASVKPLGTIPSPQRNPAAGSFALADEPADKPLAGIPSPQPAGKPEGMALLAESPECYELLIVFDGLIERNAARFRAVRPRLPSN